MDKGKKSTEWAAALLIQGWISLAFWMVIGLFLEGLMGYKIPAYLEDSQRRELFRLAHTHGTLLGLLLIIGAICAKQFALEIGAPPRLALKIGTILMPTAFFIAGIWHSETDPGLAIWLVPVAAILNIWAVITFALSALKIKNEHGD